MPMHAATPFVVLALMLAACAPPAPAPAEQTPATEAPVDANALTAQGWGPLHIGMTRAEVVAALGEDANPEAVGGPDPASCDQFRPANAPEGMLVMIQEGRLTSISLVRDATLKTDRGFGIGDTAAAIKAAYGADAHAQPHHYEAAPAEYITIWSVNGPTDPNTYVEDDAARGIRYEIGGDGKVSSVHAGGPSIQYVEGCA